MARGAMGGVPPSPPPHALDDNYIIIGVFIKLGFTTGNENRGLRGDTPRSPRFQFYFQGSFH
jgi:hypothetical protein